MPLHFVLLDKVHMRITRFLGGRGPGAMCWSCIVVLRNMIRIFCMMTMFSC
jgi:hypothetical protein